MTKWVKVPGPGEFRGEGRWKALRRTEFSLKDYETFVRTGYLPTHEGDAPPEGEPSGAKPPASETFKVQRDETGKRLLIYNKSTSIWSEIEDPDGVEAAKFGLRPLTKGYWRGFVDEAGLFQAIRRVKDRDW